MTQFKDESLLILDVRGLLIRRASVASTEGGIRTDDGKVHPTWKAGLTEFLHREIIPLLDNTPPRRVIAVWDGGNEYRTGLYPRYKEKRRQKSKETPEELKKNNASSINETKRFLAYLGVKNVWVPGQEADDVIALFCDRLSKNRKILVKTVDADLLQLVSPNVNVIYGDQLYQEGSTYTAKSNGTINEVPVNLIRLYKTLVGDSSDGYNGVYGVGPKTWQKLFAAYGADGMHQIEEGVKKGSWATLEAAWKATDDKGLGAILERWSEFSAAYLLASLNPEICYGERDGKVLKPEWLVRVPSREKLSWTLQGMGALDLLARLNKHFPVQTLFTAENHEQLVTEMSSLMEARTVAFDFESYDTLCHAPYQQASASGRGYVDVLSQSITGISWCYGANYEKVGYVSLNHADTENLSPDWASYVLSCLTKVPEQVVQNANFELTVAKQDLNFELLAPFDTQIMSSYVDENLESHLKGMTKDWFHYQQQTYQEVTDGKAMNELSAGHVLSYGCDDSLVSVHLFDLFRLIMQLEGVWEFYQENEILHVKDNVNSFIQGTRIDLPFLAAAQKEDAKLVKEASSHIRRALQDNAMNKPEDTHTLDATRLLDLYWETAGLKQQELTDEQVTKQYETLKKDNKNTPLLQTTEEIRAHMQQERYNTLWAKAWLGSSYIPYTEEVVEKDFVPSALNFTKLLRVLGSSLTIESLGSTWFSDLRFANEEEINKLPKVKTLFSLMSPILHKLKKPKDRTGPEYEALSKFCTDHLAAAGGTKTLSHGDALNFDSSDQMQQLLYGKLSLPVRRRSKVIAGSFRDTNELKGAAASGNKGILPALVHDVQEGDWRQPVLMDYLAISEAQQNESLYYKPYPLWVSPVDGMIHPQLKNCGTVTRRPSGTAPNVLQVSNKGEAKIRRAYLPWQEDYVWLCLDFNGQELRLTASESRDPVMMDAYLGPEHKGPHTVTAGRIAEFLLPRMGYPDLNRPITYEEYKTWSKGEDKELAKALKEIRNKFAKQTNFLIVYVGGPSTLAENLIIPLPLAEQIMSSILQLYAGIDPWQREVAEYARVHGYVETAYGNRRHVSDNIYSLDKKLRSRAERQAVNMLAQGCAADILKVVLTQLRKKNIADRYKIRSLMPIYDELACCVPAAAAADYAMEVSEIMAVTPPGHPIPMEAELQIGVSSWGAKQNVPLEHAAINEFLKRGTEKAA
jgi:DNA polymerase I-like protein with 3'-5' exonuclease and polymerase domains/5'-3' exonuclease